MPMAAVAVQQGGVEKEHGMWYACTVCAPYGMRMVTPPQLKALPERYRYLASSFRIWSHALPQ